MNKTRLIFILIIIYIAFMVACQKGQLDKHRSSSKVSSQLHHSMQFSDLDLFMI